jgi:DNA (cytosine-5)-methyltransferase 1
MNDDVQPLQSPIRFIEMFCGIGGFRHGLERAKMARQGNGEERNGSDIKESESWQQPYYQCVWANDNDRHACQVYRKNFGGKELFEGDIRSVDAGSIPDFDLLTAGFPCQPFSVAGRRRRTSDPRGTLFGEVLRVLEAKRPQKVLLENVPGLLSIEGGETFAQIILSLGELGYFVEWQVLDSQHFGVPQHRERVFIVGHLGGEPARTVFPVFEGGGVPSEEVGGECEGGEGLRGAVSNTIDARYGALRNAGEPYILSQIGIIGKDSEATGVYDPAGVARTIKNGGGMGAKTGLYAISSTNPKKPDEQKKYHLSDVSRCIPSSNAGNNNPLVYEFNKGNLEKTSKHCPTCVCDLTDKVFNKDPEETDDHCPTCTCNNPKLNAIIERRTEEAKKIRKMAIRKGHDWSPRRAKELVPREDGLGNCVTANESKERLLTDGTRIRRLTPTECERLQGFPDGWTEGISDTQRYKCLGNAVTTNVIAFLGQRILEVMA